MSVNNTTASFSGDLSATNKASIEYTRDGTVATLTSTDHGLIIGEDVYITASSDTGAIPLGYYTVITVPSADTFTITCQDDGAESGETVTYDAFVDIDMDGIYSNYFYFINKDASPIDIRINKTAGQYSFVTLPQNGSLSIPAGIGSIMYKSGANVITCSYLFIGVDNKK